MSPEEFCYWLQGFVEIVDSYFVTPEQWSKILNNLPSKQVDVQITMDTPEPTYCNKTPEPFWSGVIVQSILPPFDCEKVMRTC